MKKPKVITISLAILALSICTCAPITHHVRLGTTADELTTKLGPPTRVNQSTAGVQVYEYEATDLLNSGTFYYYIQDGKVIKTDMTTRH
jgi:hypothetical protein